MVNIVVVVAWQLRSQLATQLSALQAEFDGVTVRLEEETEAAQNARAALQRLQNDYQILKSKYDKEILVLTEELEEIR